jgi:hypothetical protein
MWHKIYVNVFGDMKAAVYLIPLYNEGLLYVILEVISHHFRKLVSFV